MRKRSGRPWRWPAVLAGTVAGSLLAGCFGGVSVPRPSASATPAPQPPTVAGSGTRSAVPTTPGSPAPAPATPPRSTPGGATVAYVRVSVATVWRSPRSPRPVDRPALGDPVDVRGWLAAMSLDDRRGLQGRADTQVLLGERVLVVGREPGWARVLVPDQPSPASPDGYPGWLPADQLTVSGAPATARAATVVTPTAWLYRPGSTQRLVEVSFGTRLPVTGDAGGWVALSLPDGLAARVPASQVAVTGPAAAALPATGADLVRTAALFLGLPYLWAGTSGFGFDCSGLTYLDFRAHGLAVPRDADPQARSGRPVPVGGLRAGDLAFFADPDGFVHHVGIAVGDGTMLDSPDTGGVVERVPLGDYSLARRYLP